MEKCGRSYSYYHEIPILNVSLSQLWAPPTPPHDENDVYIDKTVHFLYEPTIMPETQLPPVYIKKEKKKIKVESITSEW